MVDDRRFPLLGPRTVPLIGRDALLKRMVRALTKSTPDHLQVIGPKYAGKTVLLAALARRLRESSDFYAAVIHWNLAHQTPTTDADFLIDLAKHLAGAIAEVQPVYADALRQALHEERLPDVLDEVVGCLGREGTRVLVMLDGCDALVVHAHITRALWEKLRILASDADSLTLITASCRPMPKLILEREARNSPFWNIFNLSPCQVGCFNESDMALVLANMPEWILQEGAKTELTNAANGFPLPTLEILNQICEQCPPGEVTPAGVQTATEAALATLNPFLGELWQRCSLRSQTLMRRLIIDNKVAYTGSTIADARELLENGLAQQHDTHLRRPSRLLVRFLAEQPDDNSAMSQLFSTPETWHRNVAGVLKYRLDQLDGLDERLRDHLETLLGFVPGKPIQALGNVRMFADEAIALIMDAEIVRHDPDERLRVPSDWLAYWRRNDEKNIERWDSSFPQDRAQLRLLDLMTGTKNSSVRARYVSKPTYALINAIYPFGNFGQHRGGQPVEVSTAYATLYLCVELAAALRRELPTTG